MTVYTAQTYNDPSGLNSDPGDPVTSELMKAALFNPRAIAQAASGADTMQQAMHLIGTVSAGTDGTSYDFDAADITGYHEIRVVGGCDLSFTTTGEFHVDVDFGASGWITILNYTTASGSEGIVCDVNMTGLDLGGAGNTKFGYGRLVSKTGTDWRTLTGDAWSTDLNAYSAVANAAEGVRVTVNGTGGTIKGGTTPTRFALYGRKIV